MKSWLRMMVAVGVAVVGTAGSVKAGFVPTFQAGSSGGGTFVYTLDFTTSAGTERLDPYALPTDNPPFADEGGLVTIYDFDFGTNDPTTSVTVPANFAFTTQMVGINADGTLPNDLATGTNVSFYYTGPSVSIDTVFTGFTLLSSITTTTTKPNNFTGQTTNLTTTPPSPLGFVGDVIVAGVVIPEPASAILVGLGGLGCLALFRHRRRAHA